MYPGFMHWWKEAQRRMEQEQGAHAGFSTSCGPGARGAGGGGAREHVEFWAGEHDGGASFGVRRPLRFMAHRLELKEEQIAELASILDELKTERAQAAVDYRRSVGSFADALAGEAFDAQKAKDAAQSRVVTAERLRDAVLRALERTHKMLDAEQRKQLAYLLRSGQLTI